MAPDAVSGPVQVAWPLARVGQRQHGGRTKGAAGGIACHGGQLWSTLDGAVNVRAEAGATAA
jgi:hypothetical protein